MPKAKRPDPFAYAMGQKRSVGGRIGWFATHPDALADVMKFVDAWRKGSQMGLPQAHDWLRKYHDYPSTVSALRMWLHSHYPGWNRG